MNNQKGVGASSNESEQNPIKEMIKTAFWLAVFTSGVVISLCSAFPIVKPQTVEPGRIELLRDTIELAEVIHEDLLLGRMDAIEPQLNELLRLNHSAISNRAPTVWIDDDSLVVILPQNVPQSCVQFEPTLLSIGFTFTEPSLTCENQTGYVTFERTYASAFVQLLKDRGNTP